MENIIKELEKISRLGYSPSNIFSDWLDLMLFALTGEEEKYLETVRKYNNEREIGSRPIDYLANAFGLLMQEMQSTNKEILGDIYMSWNVSNKCHGQYFTPSHVCELMARITGESKGTVNDPTCGAGAMLIARAKLITNEDLYESYFVGQDIDFTCVRMTALNMLFFNLNGLAICGNTLLVEAHSAYQTTRTPLGGIIKKLSDEEVAILQENMRAGLEKKSVIPYGGVDVDFKRDKKNVFEEQLSIF